jgi:hypothetical protein
MEDFLMWPYNDSEAEWLLSDRRSEAASRTADNRASNDNDAPQRQDVGAANPVIFAVPRKAPAEPDAPAQP